MYNRKRVGLVALAHLPCHLEIPALYRYVMRSYAKSRTGHEMLGAVVAAVVMRDFVVGVKLMLSAIL